MKYKIRLMQEVDHTRNDGTIWQSTEELNGEAHDMEELNALIGIVTSCFTRTAIEITVSATDDDDEEEE